MINNKLLLKSKKYLESKFYEVEPRSILQKGDVLTNIVRTAVLSKISTLVD